MFDLIINNGNILDGSGRPPFQSNIGIKDGRIAAFDLSDSADATSVRDAKGAYIMPGIVDAHTHGDYRIIEKPVNQAKLQQGVTCELVGNCGFSLAPHIAGEGWTEMISNIIGRPKLSPWEDLTFSRYMDQLRELALGQHCAAMIGSGTIRYMIRKMKGGTLTSQERALARRTVEEAIEAGAVGLSSGLIYAPDLYSDQEDLLSMVSGLVPSQSPYVTHVRGEGIQLVRAIEEVIRISAQASVPLHISHFKAMGPDSWHLLEAAIERIEAARSKGQDITCDVYPYTGGATTMTALLPPWVMEGGTDKAVERLSDSLTRQSIVQEVQSRSSCWDNVLPGIGWSNVIIASAASEDWKEEAGRSIEEIAKRRDIPPIDVFLNMLVDTRCDVACVHMSMRMEDVEKILKLPFSFVASDSIYVPEDALHPRVFGTFPRVLHWSLTKGLLSLEEAVRKMTALPASRFRLDGRGLLAEGYWADMTVFTPAVEDRASYRQGDLAPSGIVEVYVEGKLMFNRGSFQEDCYPGKVLTSKLS